MIGQMRAKVDAGEISLDEAEAMISGSLTPNRMEYWRSPDTGAGGTSGLLKNGKDFRENGQPIQIRLADQVANKRSWPTPQASDNRDRGCMEDPSIKRRVKIGKQLGLSTEVKDTKQTGSLNPDWVEWLMNWPISWTSLEPMKELLWLDWSVDPADSGEIPRVSTGVKHRVDRLKAIGNGQVCACMALAWNILSGTTPKGE